MSSRGISIPTICTMGLTIGFASIARAEMLTFTPVCDTVWQTCCDCQTQLKCINWNREPAAALQCPDLPTIDDDVTITEDCTVQPGSAAAGSITVNDGALTIDGRLLVRDAATFVGGTVAGSGTLIANVDNTGSVFSPGASIGSFTIASSDSPFIAGNYTQGSDAILLLEVDGSGSNVESDLLTVDEIATLNGTLAVALVNGFVPADGEIVTVMTAGLIVGQFAEIDRSGFPEGVSVLVQQSPGAISLRFRNPGGVTGSNNNDGIDMSPDGMDDNDPPVTGGTDSNGDADNISTGTSDATGADMQAPASGPCGAGIVMFLPLLLLGWRLRRH